MDSRHSFLIVLVISAVTAFLRFAPFLIFGGKRKTPEFISYLSSVLPYAIMGMLVVYCLRNVNIMSGSRGLPEFLAVAAVAGLHLWKKNTLLSIAGGTAVYMLLIQTIFV